jgi:tRNA nucleotidyltransferase (CCA-adding enzyme)
MHLILTHEQADFDALASLFGAHLLDERALPVLPRRLNRNVSAFLTLYGEDFPFVEARDLPQETVESVTLVDTQSLVTLKGVNKKTQVRVIDHHAARRRQPDEWQVNVAEVGATATLLVEALQERNGHYSVLQATLLLLGIYEDTGALTYAITSSRDARAAAYLLEIGASLKIAADFLNPPLSVAQRSVYDQLLEDAQTHLIQGHRIVVACAQALEMSEEISSLARSTSDQIDVASIAAQFGGGGHDRAAAALVRAEEGAQGSDQLESLRQELLAMLPGHVKPSITVAQIMSRGPQVLKPETSVQQVARLMQRYGYEGYPIVRDGLVVGLLTRRAVDRAISHKLNLTAASLMEAGAVSVQPGDSVQHLQVVMTDSGWGQVPVVEPEGGEVIGIVTRTDLLKVLAPQASLPASHNLAERLEETLPVERQKLVRLVADEAVARQMAVYLVGGFVRDLLFKRPSTDFDVVVEGDAIALARSLAKAHGGKVTSHTRFGTAKWFLADSTLGRSNMPTFLDLISARSEFYERPTALPTVERGSIKLDLHRRDFTINTLAVRLDGRHYGELYDYWGGLNDLENGLVRVLHSLSFVDDPTRMLRAVRFEQRFDFQIEARTLQLMGEARSLLERLSGERVRHELDLILDEPRAVDMLKRLSELDLLSCIHPALSWEEKLAERLQTALEATIPERFAPIPDVGGIPRRRALGYLTWLLPLALDDLRSVGKRLRFPAALVKVLTAAGKLRADLSDFKQAEPSRWVARLEDAPLISVYAAYLSVEEKWAQGALAQYLSTWRHIEPSIDGHDLKARGLPPGPHYREVLERLRAAWLDGKIETQAQETYFLDELISHFQ